MTQLKAFIASQRESGLPQPRGAAHAVPGTIAVSPAAVTTESISLPALSLDRISRSPQPAVAAGIATGRLFVAAYLNKHAGCRACCEMFPTGVERSAVRRSAVGWPAARMNAEWPAPSPQASLPWQPIFPPDRPGRRAQPARYARAEPSIVIIASYRLRGHRRSTMRVGLIRGQHQGAETDEHTRQHDHAAEYRPQQRQRQDTGEQHQRVLTTSHHRSGLE